MEDRWILCRRMAGDGLCQEAFYGVCTFIWLANGIQTGTEIQWYQDSIIENVCQSKNGQYSGYLSYKDLKKLVKQICILGPLAGMYGRDIEQEMMHPTTGYYISERKFAHSVDAPKYAFRKGVIHQHPEKPARSMCSRSESSDHRHRE